MSRKKISTTIYVTPEQSDRLKLLHERTKVPVAVYIREGIDLVLQHYSHLLPGQLPLVDGSRAAGTSPSLDGSRAAGSPLDAARAIQALEAARAQIELDQRVANQPAANQPPHAEEPKPRRRSDASQRELPPSEDDEPRAPLAVGVPKS